MNSPTFICRFCGERCWWVLPHNCKGRNMNEQVDNALGGHGFATVTSTQVSEPLYTRDELVEMAAFAMYCNDAPPHFTIEELKVRWADYFYRMEIINDAKVAINALLATGQLKVGE